MNLPSRGERESATTTRYTGFFFDPIRASLILAAMKSFLPLLLSHDRLQVRHLPLAELLHHLLHLLACGEQLVHLLDGRPAPRRDSRAARAVDDLGPRALVGGHREDDRLHAPELPLVDVDALDLLAEARDEREDVPHGPHPPHHLVGLQEVVERKAPLPEALLELLLLILLRCGLGPLDEREHVSHAEDARRHAIRVEVLELVELLAGRREL